MSSRSKSRRHLAMRARYSESNSHSQRALRFESLEDRRLLAITVDTLADTVANDGVTSLREAITNASPGETINFSVNGFITTNSTLTINKPLTIDGGGNIVIDGGDGIDNVPNNQNGFRLFNIDDNNNSNTNVTLRGLTLTGADPSDSSLSGAGGAIRNRENLTIENSTITGNSASNGGGIFNYGNLTLHYSTVSMNTARASGGGLFNNSTGNGGSTPTAIVTASTFHGNDAVTGGAVLPFGTFSLSNSTISGNAATGRGGGIGVAGGVTTISYSTLSHNSAGIEGGVSFITTARPFSMAQSSPTARLAETSPMETIVMLVVIET